jgi:hypothetical protein
MPFTIFLAPEFPFDYSGIPENAEAAAQNFSALPLIFLYFYPKNRLFKTGDRINSVPSVWMIFIVCCGRLIWASHDSLQGNKR